MKNRWFKVFVAAVQGTCADSTVGEAGGVVNFAAKVADEAIEEMERRGMKEEG